MLRIAARHVEAIGAARTATDLHDLVQAAIRLEFSTIPPYLTAMLSLRPGANREIWGTIHAVVVDEMLHMTIGCNLLNALGGRPLIDDAAFLPRYPGPLPLSIGGGLEVGLEPFSIDLMQRVFMQIEEPENPIDLPVFAAAAPPSFATIGQFYFALIDKVRDLGDAIFVGDPARQVVSAEWFPARLLPITNAEEAVRALTLIVEEGEGTPLSPIDPDGEVAHYYRFQEIFRLKRIAKDDSVPEGFSFSGPAIPFDPAAVYPLTHNQCLADLDANSQSGRRARQFAFVFTKLLKALQRTFDGEPDQFDDAIGLMFELKLAGQILAGLPAVKDGVETGLNAGPAFEYRTESG